MARENDFYLTFGSNAAAWAASLKSELAPVRQEVTEIQALLAAVDRSSNTVGGKVSRALAGGAQGQQTGGSGGGGGFSQEKLFTALDAASSEINNITRQLGTVVKGLDAVPAKLATVLRSIQGQVDAANRSGDNRPSIVPGQRGFVSPSTQGAVRTNSIEHQVSRAVIAGLAKLPNTPSLLGVDLSKFKPQQPAIASVSKEAIDKAGVDRIVRAIDKQTRVLKDGLKVRGGAPSAEGVPVNQVRAAKKDRRATAAAVESTTQDQAAELAAMDTKISRLIELVSSVTGEAGDQARDALAKLRASRDVLQANVDEVASQEQSTARAAANKAERKELGISRAEQSQRRSDAAKAEAKARPVISARELEERRQRAALLASPADPTFLDRATGPQRKGTDRYGVAQLEQMVQAFREVGIEVKNTSRTSKAELANNLVGASEQYRRDNPEGNELARTEGFNVRRETELGQSVRRIVGDLGDLAEATERATAILRADAKGGGKSRDAAVGGIETQPGNIGTPPGLIKGREERGSGLGTLYTEEEFQAAKRLRQADPDRERARALELAAQPDFNPYDRTLNKDIKSGGSPADVALAQAARDRLRDVRLATRAIDILGQDFLELSEAFGENARRAKILDSRIGAANAAGLNPDEADLDQRRQVRQEQENLQRAGQNLPPDLVQLFRTPAYKEGLRLREGNKNDELLDLQGQPIGARQIQEAQRLAYQKREKGLSDYDTIRSGSGIATAGMRSGLGTRQLMRPIPGLTFFDGQYRPDTANTGKMTNSQVEAASVWTPKQTAKIDSATNDLTKAQVDYALALRKARDLNGDSTEGDVELTRTNLAEAAVALQKAGNLLANRLAARTFGNLAPSLESLTGFEPKENLRGQLNIAERTRDRRLANGAETEMVDGEIEALKEQLRRVTPDVQLDPKIARDEEVRQTAREKAERERTRRIGANSIGEKARKAELELAARRAQLASATAEQEKATRQLTEREEELAQNFETYSRTTQEAIRQANDRIPELERELNALQRQAQTNPLAAEDETNVNPNVRLEPVPGPSDGPEVQRRVDALAAERKQLATARGQLTKATNKGDTAKIATAQVKVDRLRNSVDFLAGALNTARSAQAERNRLSGSDQVVGREVSVFADEIKAKEAELDRLRGVRNQVIKPAGEESAGGPTLGQQLAEAIARRPKITQQIAEARDEGDLSENAGYHAAKDEQGRNEAKIKQLKQQIEQGGGVEAYEALQTQASRAADEVKELTAQLQAAEKAVENNNKAVRDRQAELRAERDTLRAQGPYKQEDIQDLYGPERDAATARRDRLNEIRRESNDLKEAGVLDSRKGEPEPAPKAAAEKQTGVDTAERDRLRAERAELQKGPHTRGDLKDLRAAEAEAKRRASTAQGQVTRASKTGDVERIAKAEERLAQRRTELAAATTRLQGAETARKRLSEIGTLLGDGGSGAGGGRGGRGAAGEGRGGGRDRDILSKILERLNGIHTTIKGGIKYTGPERTPDRVKPFGPQLPPFIGPKPNTQFQRDPNGPVNIPDSVRVPRNESILATSEDDRVRAQQAAAQRRRIVRLEEDPALKSAVVAKAQVDAQRIAQAKANKETGDSVLAASRLASANDLLSESTKREIAALRELTQAKASDADITRQQLAVVQAIGDDTVRRGVGVTGRREATTAVLQDVDPNVGNGKIGELERTAKAANGFRTVDQTFAAGVPAGGIFGDQSLFTQEMFGNKGFWSRIMSSTGAFVVRNFTAGFVFGLTDALQQVISQAILTESTFVRVSHALEATGRDIGTIRGDLGQLASDYAVPLNDVYEIAASLTGLFSTNDELVAGTKIVTQLQLISNGALNASEAAGAIASIEAAFGPDLSDRLGGTVAGMQQIADVLTSVQNNVGTNAEVTAEAVGSLSGLGQQLGLSYEEIAVYGAQIAKLTNSTGAAAGESFSRVLAATQSAGGRAAIREQFNPSAENARRAGVSENIGQEVTEALNAGDYSNALKLMMEGWDALSEAQRRNLTVALGGQRQARTVAALFSNGAKSLDDIAKATDSYGDASERADRIILTLNKQIEQFSVNLATIASNLIQTGVLNSVGIILVGTNKLLAAFSKVLTFLNYLAESNPITEFARDATFTLLGLAAAAFVVRKAFQGMRQSLAAARENSPFIDGVARPLPPAKLVPDNAVSRLAGFKTDKDTGTVTPPTQRPGVFSRPGGDEGGFRPLTRITGAVLRPLGEGVKAVGRPLTRFSEALEVSRRAMLVQAAAAEATGARTAIVSGAATGTGAVTGRAGQGINAFGDFLSSFGRGEGGDYLNRGSQRVGTFADRLQARADVNRAASTNFGTGQVSNPGLRALSTAQTAFAGGATRTASSLNRLGRGVDKLRASGIGADIALGVLGAAITGFVLELQESAAVRKDLDKNRVKAGLIEPESTGTEQGKDEDGNYIGPFSEQFAEQGKVPKLQGSKFGGVFTAGGSVLSSLNPLSNRVGQFDNNFNRAFGQSDSGGTYGEDEANDAFFKGLTTLSEAAQAPGATADKLVEANKKVQSDLQAAAQKMSDALDAGEISEQQFLSGMAQLELIGQQLDDAAGSLLGSIYNLSAGILTGDQNDTLTSLRGALAPLGSGQSFLGAGGNNARSSLLRSTGLEEDSPYQRNLARIASARSGSESQNAEIELIDKQLAAANIDVDKAVKNPGKTEDGKLEEARQRVQSLLAERMSKVTAFLQTTVDEGQLAAAEAAASGDLAGSDDAFGVALRRLDNRARKEGLTSDIQPGGFVTASREGDGLTLPPGPEQLNYFAQRRALQQSRAEAAGSLSTSQARVRAARDNDPFATATADRDAAKTVLDRLKAARRKEGDLGASVEQIRAAQIDYFNKSRDLAKTAADIQTSALSAQAAATWNGAARSSIERQIAMQNLQTAIQSGTPQEQDAARGALAQARMSEVQAFEEQRSAAAETRTAMIAPGDAVAVARDQLRNAQEAQQFALRFGATSTQYQQATQAVISAQQAVDSSVQSVAQANFELIGAYASARGDAVAAAAASTNAARAAYAEALRLAGGNAQAASVLQANAAVVNSVAAEAQSQQDLIASQSAIGIALANAAGRTVQAAGLTLRESRRALAAALKRSGGENTSEVNGLRAQVISDEASARDARLQDELDTIDFNLQMGKITQSSAITALKEILRTSDLTKQQRRQLLLQIKGMKDELADTQFNFGDIRLPTPYQLRRYITQRREEFRNDADTAAAASSASGRASGSLRNDGLAQRASTTDNRTSTTTIYIDGADTGKVKKIIEDTVGGRSSINTRTTGARRGR